MIPPVRFLVNGVARLLRLALLPALFCGTGLVSASPRGDLLRYVPDDTALCVLVEGLREHSKALAASPFVARLGESSLGKNAADRVEIKKLLAIEKQVETFTGLTATQLRADVLGDLVVLAYKPGPPGKMDQEQGLVLVHARDPKALAKLVQHINDFQTKTGELKGLEERTHRGVTYVCRKEKGAPTFYALRESVLLFSGQEAMLKRAIDLDADLKPDAVAPLERLLQRLGVAGSLLTLWVNPRAYDADLAGKVAKAQGAEAIWLKNFQTYWKALDALAIAVQLDSDLTVSLALAGQADQLSTAARSVLGKLAEPSRLWRTMPEEPLLAFAGRLDFKALLDMLLEFQPAGTRRPALADLNRVLAASLEGKEFVREVLPALGPDLGLIVLPPTDPKALFPQFLLALRVQPSNDPTSVGQAVLEGVHFGARLAASVLPLTLNRASLDKLDIRSLSGGAFFPMGVQPAYALVRGHLTLASSPEVLRVLAALLSADATPDAAVSGPFPLVRISFTAWRAYLQQRKEELATHLTGPGQRREDVDKQIRTWIAVLAYLDRAELRQQPGPGRILLQVALRPHWPLK